MALPTSPTWNIADFSGPTLGGLLTLGPGDLTITPSTSPYFSYNGDFSVLTARSADAVLAQLDLIGAAIPARYTIEVTLRFPEMPHNLGDLSQRRAGFLIADDAGRGIAVYFASSGMAVGRIDDFGSVTALPDTTDLTEEIATGFKTIRIAVDSGQGRAYVMLGDGSSVGADVRYILPVEETPPTVTDALRFFVKGLPSQPSRVEIRALRVAGSLVIPDFPPTADAGPDRVAPVGSTVRLDGRSSFDVEGAPLTYQWRMVDAPFGSQYAADNSSGVTTDDGDGDGFTDTLSFTALSLPGWVSAGDVLRIGAGQHIIDTFDNLLGQLTVRGETIPDNFSDIPFRVIRQSALVGAQTETPYAVPDVQGIYRFELVVNDGVSDSEPAEVLASVVGARAPFGVEPDVSPIWKALGDEWRLIEGRGVFEEAWRGVAQIMSGKLLEVWQHHYNYSIRDAQRTFQRKWLAYRSLITETAPNEVQLRPRFGLLRATHQFEAGTPTVAGLTLVIEYPTGPETVSEITVTLTGNSLSQIVADLNAALVGTQITAYAYAVRGEGAARRYLGMGTTVDDGDGDGYTATFSFTPSSLPSWVSAGDTLLVGGTRFVIDTVNNVGGSLTVSAPDIPDNFSGEFLIFHLCRLGIRSSSRGFRVLSSSTAAGILGFEIDRFSYLDGVNGALVTDRSFYCGDGVDLHDHDIRRGDLLVLNGGQSFVIDRVLTGPNDPLPGQRLLLSDPLPADADTTWSIPSVVLSAEVDYEFEGTYPGDLVKAEVYDLQTDRTADVRGYVVAQKGRQIAAHLTGFYGAFVDTDRYELRLLGVKRRKALPIYADTLGIPRLQDLIPAERDPDVWQENIDYVLEPFYRERGGAPIPMLQFRDDVFITPDLEPPDIFWAELTVFSNDKNIEDLFGALAGFLRDDASTFPRDFNYAAGVAGLLYAQQRGPSVRAIHTGAQILFGQPFAEVAGYIEEIRSDYSPTSGRMLVRDDSGEPDSPSEIVRTYYYKKDPLDLSPTSGLAINASMGLPWAEGDLITQFSPIGAGVSIIDMYNDRRWYVPYVRSGLMTEIEKFHTFLVRFNFDLVTLTNLSLLFQFVMRVKPTHTHPLLVGTRVHEDDLDIIDDLGMVATMRLLDTFRGYPQVFAYDDYRGDGTIWSEFDDGSTYFDGIVDIPLDTIEFLLTIVWAGGVITYDSAFFVDTVVTDVSGAHTGIPGSTFTPTYDMTLPAGTYLVTVVIKGGGVVLP
jgi:hypothetical protein